MLCPCLKTKQDKTHRHSQGWFKEIFGDDGYVNDLIQLTVSQ